MPYTLVKRIKRSGWPVFTKAGKVSKKWKKSHPAANRAEKKANPRLFKAIQRRVAKMPSNELAGTHTRGGKIKVSKKFLNMFPKKMRKRVADSIGKIHEPTEHKGMKKRRSKK